MATPHDGILQEMEALLAAMGEGTLDDDGRRRLAELVKQEPEARQLYLDHCQMHAMLRSAHGVLSSLEPPKVGRPRRSVWLAAGLLAVATSVVIALISFYDRAPRPAAAVVAVEGDVRVSGDDTPKPLQVGTSIAPGQRIQTGTNGTADLRLGDGTNIRLGSVTDVGIVQQRALRQVQLKVGVVRCEVTKQSPGQPLVFQTPHAELTVLGTAFELLATPVESRVRVLEGRVRWTTGGRSVEVGAGEASTADIQGVQAWQPVCNLDFSRLKTIPPQLETIFCDTTSLHTAKRIIVPACNGLRLDDGGLRFVDPRPVFGDHGLIVSRWTDDIGSDVVIEVDVSAGAKWSLGLAVDGDSFDGYRVIFAAPRYPNGIEVDSLYPRRQMLLAQDPRPIPAEQDHTLRVEKQGSRFRVWVDRELRIDTVVEHPLAKDRKRSFALSNFGESPLIRALRVWKAVGH